MRPSEAILLGSIGTKQCYGGLFRNGKTCAAGAALVAIGQLDPSRTMAELYTIIPDQVAAEDHTHAIA